MLDMWTLFTQMLEVLALLGRLVTSISSQMVAPGNLAAKSTYFVSYSYTKALLRKLSFGRSHPRSYPERALLDFVSFVVVVVLGGGGGDQLPLLSS